MRLENLIKRQPQQNVRFGARLEPPLKSGTCSRHSSLDKTRQSVALAGDGIVSTTSLRANYGILFRNSPFTAQRSHYARSSALFTPLFKPFSAGDEAELVSVLTTRPRHVLRKVRLMVEGSRQRLATFRNTVTYLMIVLQAQLQKKVLSAEAATEIIAVILEECTKWDTSDLAHLLFRASLRFAKYGVKTSPRTMHLLLQSYKNAKSARELMLKLGGELQGKSSTESLAIAAYLFAKDPARAEKVRADLKQKGPLTINAYQGLVEGYARLGNTNKVVENIKECVNAKTIGREPELEDSDDGEAVYTAKSAPNRKEIVNMLVEDALCSFPAEYGKAEDAEKIVQLCERHGTGKLSDETLGHLVRLLLSRAQDSQSIMKVEERAKSLSRSRGASGEEGTVGESKMGIHVLSAIVSALSRVRDEESKASDGIMREKVSSLRLVLEQRLESVETRDDVTGKHLSILVRGYSALGDSEGMKSIVSMLRTKGYTCDTTIYIELLRGFGSMGNVKDLLALKEQMDKEGVFQNAASYAALFRGLGKYYPTLLDRYEKEMRSRGIRHEPVTYCALIPLYNDMQNLNKIDEYVADIHRRHERGEFMFTFPMMCAILRAYVSDFERASRYIDVATTLSLDSDPMVQSCICSVYTYHEKMDELLLFLKRTSSYGIEVYNQLISYYGRKGNWEKLKETLQNLRVSRIPYNEHTYTALVHVYAKNKAVNKIADLLQDIKDSHMYISANFYSAVALAYQTCENSSEVEVAWRDLLASRVPIPTRVYNQFLELFVEQNNFPLIQQVLGTMMSRLPPNSITLTTVIDMLGRLGRVEEMESVFEEMVQCAEAQPTAVTYHHMMSAYAKRGDVTKMETMRRKMHEVGCYDDSGVTYNVLLVGYTRAKQFEKIPEIIAEREKRGMPMDDISYGVLIRTYGFCQLESRLDEVVRKVETQLAESGSASPNVDNAKRPMGLRLLFSIASAYQSCNHKAKVHHYGEQVLTHPQRGLREINGILVLYCRMSDSEAIESVLGRFGSVQNAMLYNTALRGLARSKLWDRVPSLLDRMKATGVGVDATTGMELSAALMKNGDMELAKRVLLLQQSDDSVRARKGKRNVSSSRVREVEAQKAKIEADLKDSFI